MVVKVYVSGISGNKEVKKRQQRVLLILDSKSCKYEVIDIAEPGNEEQKDFMQTNSTSNGGTISDPNPRHPLPPQIFNDEEYCGDYDKFDMANEIDEMEIFLKLAPDDSASAVTSNAEIKLGNGDVHPTSDATTNEDAKEELEEAAEQIVNDDSKADEGDALGENGKTEKEATPDKEVKDTEEQKDKEEDKEEDEQEEAEED